MLRTRIALSIAAFVLSCPVAHAQLTINPTFDSTITNDPNSATIIATINQAIAVYHASFSDNVTADITFREMNTGLGMSQFSFFFIPYNSYRAALVSHATTANDATALAHLPNQAGNPINNGVVDVGFTNARALGLVSSGTTG